MESPVKRLYQRRAILGARCGDPESPASGTLLARKRRLEDELQDVEVREIAELAAAISGNGGGLAVAMTKRTLSAIQRDMQRVEREIDDLSREIERLDARIAEVERGRRH
jgi:hypothetical protein